MVFAGVCIKTADVKRLANFYKKILKTTSDYDSDIHQEIATNGAALAIMKTTESDNTKNVYMNLMFTVEDVDREHSRLQKLGIPITELPTTRPWGARNMTFRDPDGNNVTFRSFMKGCNGEESKLL